MKARQVEYSELADAFTAFMLISRIFDQAIKQGQRVNVSLKRPGQAKEKIKLPLTAPPIDLDASIADGLELIVRVRKPPIP